MSYLSKLTVKTVVRTNKLDPVIQRRQKLISATEEQLKVVEAALKGESYEVLRKAWAKNEQGEKVLVERMRKVRAWFFEQDGGWYVQCKYGNKTLELGKGGNAVFVKALADVEGALQALFMGLATQSWSAEFFVLPNTKTLLMMGETTGADVVVLQNYVKNKAIDSLILKGPGGSLSAGLSMANIIIENELSTNVPEDTDCASACSLMFSAGKIRSMETGSRFGFHLPFLDLDIDTVD